MLSRFIRIIALAALITAASVTHVFAQWPTTCVELNDIVEAHLGNHGNVGIYQRVFGADAEAACQNDHRDDVRAVFAWAIGGDEPATQPAPATVPPVSAPPAASPESHPDYERVRQTALARGADEATAHGAAAFVVTQGSVDAYLRGTHQGVAYGEHGCQWQSPQCPVAPVKPDCKDSANLSGHGTDIQVVKLCPGTYRLDMTHEGSRNFTIWVHNVLRFGSYGRDLVVNDRGSGTWVNEITVGTEPVRFQIRFANGNWRVLIRQL